MVLPAFVLFRHPVVQFPATAPHRPSRTVGAEVRRRGAGDGVVVQLLVPDTARVATDVIVRCLATSV